MTHYKASFAPKIALYEPDIPQNTAAIIRTCACLGAQLEIIEPCGFLLSDKRFKRVVMDYMDTKNINFYQSYEEFFEAKSNDRVILITTKAKKSYTDFKAVGKIVALKLVGLIDGVFSPSNVLVKVYKPDLLNVYEKKYGVNLNIL